MHGTKVWRQTTAWIERSLLRAPRTVYCRTVATSSGGNDKSAKIDRIKGEKVLVDRSALFSGDSFREVTRKSKFKTPLENELSQVILARGPISVSEFMKQSLLHPTHGYYTSKRVFGSAGDFTTAPEISQVFGELIAIWCLSTWQSMGMPSDLQIVEIGPGRGTLMFDMMRTFEKFPAFGGTCSYHLVEMSDKLQAAQQEKLSVLSSSSRARWYKLFDEIPSEKPTIVIGQEILDALPVYQFEYTNRGWRERLIDVATDETTGERAFRFVLSPGPTPASSTLLAPAFETMPGFTSSSEDPKMNETFTVGDSIEVCPAACSLAQDISKRINATGGAALFVDYGNDFAPSDSLRGIRDHKFCHPLERPGDIDLTADVDFAAVRRAVECLDGNVHVHGPTTQSEFLQKLGAVERFNQLQRSVDPSGREELESQFRRLLDPSAMGRVYKCLCISSSDIEGIVGFDGG